MRERGVADAEVAQVPRGGARRGRGALRRSGAPGAGDTTVAFDLALFDREYLQFFELKYTKSK
jgi:hypothetical protein